MKKITGTLLEHPDVIITKTPNNEEIAFLRLVVLEKSDERSFNHYCYLYDEEKIKAFRNLKKGDQVETQGKEIVIEKFGIKYRSLEISDLTLKKEKNKEKDLVLKGNLVKDVEISNVKTEDKEFQVAKFSIAVNEKDKDTTYHYCQVYDEKIDLVKDYKKGDFVSVKGYEKRTKSGEKEFVNFVVKESHMIKARDHEKTQEDEEFSPINKDELDKIIDEIISEREEFEEATVDIEYER